MQHFVFNLENKKISDILYSCVKTLIFIRKYVIFKIQKGKPEKTACP